MDKQECEKILRDLGKSTFIQLCNYWYVMSYKDTCQLLNKGLIIMTEEGFEVTEKGIELLKFWSEEV